MNTPLADEAIVHAKQAIRAEMRSRRKTIAPRDRVIAGNMAAAMLTDNRGLALFPRFRLCASYLSTAEEFPTEEIHLTLFSAGVMLAVPRFSHAEARYHWAPLAPGEPLRQGPHGIWEPASRIHAPRAAIDVVLVPGLAFDMRGGRIGYGGGIYDRLLARLRPGVLRVALAFDCQLQREVLPQEPHDLQMDYIVTESHWIDCRRARSIRRDTYAPRPPVRPA